MNSDGNLKSALQLYDDCGDEEISSAIIALLTSAVYDSTPKKSFSEIYEIITGFNAASFLDPLNSLSLLLQCDNTAAQSIISLIGECGTAKEVVLTVQEAVERLERSFDEEDEDEEAKSGNLIKRKGTSQAGQLLTLIDLYSSALRRMKPRRKSASDTLRPLFEELGAVIGLVCAKASVDQGRSLLSSVGRLSKIALKWVEDLTVDAADDLEECKLIIKRVLDHTVLSCSNLLHANIAQRTLEQCFPRLSRLQRSGSEWQEGENAALEVLDAYSSIHLPSLNSTPSPVDLFSFAYRPPKEIEPDKLLSFVLPILISSIHTNTFLDESLAVLINTLHVRTTKNVQQGLSQDITSPLCNLLPSIASIHPDSAIRYQSFRVLSLVLSSADAQLRFHHLVELTRDSEYPQMRVASIGLLKEAVLHALSNAKAEGGVDAFVGPLLLRTFGLIVFRSDPPDLFASSSLTLKDFQETYEPGRLVECLSLYYVVLQRDKDNLTKIRDKDVMKSVENTLLAPLRRSINRWMEDPAVSQSHDINAIVSLTIALERVEVAQASLDA